MKKLMTVIALLSGLHGVALCSAADSIMKAETQVRPLRYFMQSESATVSKTPYGNNTVAGRFVQAGDVRIYYEVYKPGKEQKDAAPVFIFHGGGVGTPFEMGQLIDTLRKDREVIVVSTRGHGRSEIGYSPLTYEQKARDMIAVMREETDKPSVLIGFSDGAYTCYKVAATYPEAVERIVAFGAGSLEKGFFSSELNVADLEKIDKAFVEQQKKIMPEPERWQEFCTNYMKFWNRMEVGKELFSSVKCPVLLIAGDEDDHAPLVTMVAAHQMLPNSRLCIVPKAWHTVFLDNYAVTWAAMEPFLQTELKDLQSSRKIAYNDRVIK